MLGQTTALDLPATLALPSALGLSTAMGDSSAGLWLDLRSHLQ